MSDLLKVLHEGALVNKFTSMKEENFIHLAEALELKIDDGS